MRVCKPRHLGMEQVDSEHDLLVTCVQEMHERWKAGASAEDIQCRLHNFEVIAREHFRNEEAIMRDAKYPKFTEHATSHCKLLGILQHIRIDHELGHLTSGDDVIALLSEWLTDHLRLIDAPFAVFTRQKARPASKS